MSRHPAARQVPSGEVATHRTAAAPMGSEMWVGAMPTFGRTGSAILGCGQWAGSEARGAAGVEAVAAVQFNHQVAAQSQVVQAVAVAAVQVLLTIQVAIL